jgi:hypothetical protein
MTREMCMATPEDQKPPIDYRSPVAKDPRYRQRHDIPWSQPLPRWPPTLAEEPLPAPAKPEPYRPKVGERVRLISSPCEGDFELLDKELEILDVRKPGEAYYLPRSHYACRAASVYPDRPLLVDIHRDAVWEPVAEKPEPPASEPSGKPGVKELFDLWWNRVGTSARVSPRCTFEGGFDTGRASLQAELEAERAAHEKTREDRSRILQNEAEQDEEIERLRAERDKYLAEVGRVTVAHEATKAELAESRALHEELTDRIEVELAEAIMGLVKERSESVQALSRLVDERAAHEVTKERKARPMPTMEDLGRAFFDKAQEIGVISETVNWEEAQLRGGHRSAEPYWFTLAKVALKLFGAQEEQDSGKEATDGKRNKHGRSVTETREHQHRNARPDGSADGNRRAGEGAECGPEVESEEPRDHEAGRGQHVGVRGSAPRIEQDSGSPSGQKSGVDLDSPAPPGGDSSSTMPDPLPAVLPANVRIRDTYVTTSPGKLGQSWHGIAGYYFDDDTFCPASEVDWSSVAPAQQPLDGMPTAWKERIELLEKERETVTLGAAACIETVRGLERRLAKLESQTFFK